VIGMPILFIAILAVAAVVVFEYVALRWGVDSRDDFRSTE